MYGCGVSGCLSCSIPLISKEGNKFLAPIWYNTCLNSYDVPSLPSKEAGLYLSRGLVADSFALQPGYQGHHERLFPAAGGSAITVRFRARPARNPDDRCHFQE